MTYITQSKVDKRRTNQLQQYSALTVDTIALCASTDLLHLPCIVLLNEKGRMGDTFPHSFACMDLRLRKQDNAAGNLRSLTQELGRMCRYVKPKLIGQDKFVCGQCGEDYHRDHAYALIGKSLAKKFKNLYSMASVELPPSDK